MTSEPIPRTLTPVPDFTGRFSAQQGTSRLLLRSRAAGDNHGYFTLWDYQTREELLQIRPERKTTYLLAPAISLDGRWIAYQDPVLSIWDLQTKEEVRQFEGHKHPVRRIVFLPDGKHFISAGSDGYAFIWEINPAPGEDPYVNYFKGHEQAKGPFPLTCLAVSSDGRYALTGDEDGYAILWDIESGDEDGCKAVHRFPRVDSKRYGPPTGKPYFVQKGTGEIKVYRDDHQYGAKITAVAFFPDGSHVVVADSETMVRIFDVRTGKEVARHEQRQPWLGVLAVAVSPNGRYVLMASHPHAKLWDWRSKNFIELAGHTWTHPNMQGEPGGVHSVAFSPDGKLAITGGEDGTIRLWNLPQ